MRLIPSTRTWNHDKTVPPEIQSTAYVASKANIRHSKKTKKKNLSIYIQKNKRKFNMRNLVKSFYEFRARAKPGRTAQ